MHGIYDLRDKLCKELEEYSAHELDARSLDVVDKLAHTVKNLDKIIEAEEGGSQGSFNSYNGNSMRGGYSRGDGSYRNSYEEGSYARGRRNAPRDGMGRYSGDYSRENSRDGGMVEKLYKMMEEAPDDRTRKEFQNFITKMEQM